MLTYKIQAQYQISAFTLLKPHPVSLKYTDTLQTTVIGLVKLLEMSGQCIVAGGVVVQHGIALGGRCLGDEQRKAKVEQTMECNLKNYLH